MLLVIDNYDSFVYNLVQYLGYLGAKIKVVRNDEMDVRSLERLGPARMVISPGPGTPVNAGICREAIRRFAGEIPILGVCLGHQCIGAVYGANVVRGRKPVHGKTCVLNHDGRGILAGIPGNITVARYHSLVLERESIPKELSITAFSDDGVVMAVQHTVHPVFGVQFHPESIASEYGLELLKNFLRY